MNSMDLSSALGRASPFGGKGDASGRDSVNDASPTLRAGGQVAAELSSHRMGSVFSSPAWIEALTATYGIEVKAYALHHDGAANAAVLFSEIDDIRGRRVISLPFSDYVDPFVTEASDWKRLVTPLLDSGVPLRFRCLRNDLPSADPDLTLTGRALWHAVDLDRPGSEIWESLGGSARRNIRKAQRLGVAVRIGRTLDDLRTFYRMHCHVRKSKYRLFAQPFSFFESLHASFGRDDRIFVLLAEADGVAVGGILFLVHGDTLYYKFNASTEGEYRPNDLLIWRGMMIGQELGRSRLDFGLSDPSQPGLVRFKQKFATEERAISILQANPPDKADRVAPVLHRLTEILTAPETPDELTRSVGDELYRYFC